MNAGQVAFLIVHHQPSCFAENLQRPVVENAFNERSYKDSIPQYSGLSVAQLLIELRSNLFFVDFAKPPRNKNRDL
jgi:hypothetical protein